MNNLSYYGWTETLLRQKAKSIFKDLPHGRISVTHKTRYEVVAEEGYFSCELTGNMLYGRDPSEYPSTGDWVIFQPIDTEEGLIMDVLPRQKTLFRLKSGTISERQVIAAHVDKAFIVQSLDDNFNARRLERFILQLREEEILPVVVLTKSDLEFNRTEVETALRHITGEIPVYYTSIHDSDSIVALREFIQSGETVVFTGSSGVGKSTLINALCRKDVFKTANISTSTGKGRHTSTRRELVIMEGGGILIDTPGIKVFGVTNNDADSLNDVMDFSQFEGKCRFKDCQHIHEDGCAIIEALERGEIDPGVYESYLKLRKEVWHFTASVQEKRKRGKSIARMVEEVKKRSSKYK
ncbi:ribosome small subunit-dependent GTPase A [Marinilabilia rubra]|uniref:Small ribosomal subunit biogenesis GTPase RsgA n=1 Tax=Marinilabilia rubra TaxID=2162893 RepID=A0A2U2B514_9BACT|nr:ribosome small subunit-dependent GTPase A [Marinilabilia rubra]PWD98143.1 ribosome small subunit-dependent GTPase A [Marinilabilia rubra]